MKQIKEKINLDGIKIKLNPPDLDGDGETGGDEQITQNLQQNIQPINQSSELGDSLKELNKDDLEAVTRMSGIDMRTRLHHSEIASILALDALVSLGVLPTKCLAFTRQKKRLAVSLEGKGRGEIVEVVAGKKEQDAKASGFGQGVKNFMGMK